MLHATLSSPRPSPRLSAAGSVYIDIAVFETQLGNSKHGGWRRSSFVDQQRLSESGAIRSTFALPQHFSIGSLLLGRRGSSVASMRRSRRSSLASDASSGLRRRSQWITGSNLMRYAFTRRGSGDGRAAPAAAPSSDNEAANIRHLANVRLENLSYDVSAEAAKARAGRAAKATEDRIAAEMRVQAMWRLRFRDAPGVEAEIAKMHATETAKAIFEMWEAEQRAQRIQREAEAALRATAETLAVAAQHQMPPAVPLPLPARPTPPLPTGGASASPPAGGGVEALQRAEKKNVSSPMASAEPASPPLQFALGKAVDPEADALDSGTSGLSA